ncbi:protein NEN3-like [Neltuma alba]|uniref:protein NEN3-like n=1 Tax=Neltuma alba TaxID=207710 RepID=UPI0010A44074|nr:protein NEN3-like [Prosopis alba]
MASLATYFGLGQQKHRSLDDVRMNLEVIKDCATIMFLESCLPDVFIVDSLVSPKVAARSCRVGKSLQDKGLSDVKTESVLLSPIATQCNEEKRPTTSSHIATCSSEGNKLANPVQYPQPQETCPAALSEASCSSNFTVLKPYEVFISSLTGSLVPLCYGSQRIQLLHNGFPSQLSCDDLKIRFGKSGRFHNNAGQPKLSFVVDPSESLCEVLEVCDAIALSSLLDSGRSSHNWKPVIVTRKEGSFSYPTVRLRIPISECGDATIFAAEVYKKESSSGIIERLRFNEVDTKELSSLLMPGNLVDAVFCLDQYEFQQGVGLAVEPSTSINLESHKSQIAIIWPHTHPLDLWRNGQSSGELAFIRDSATKPGKRIN